MITLEDVIWAIRHERAYQNKKWGSIKQNPHEVLAWVAIMEIELAEAKNALAEGDQSGALMEILQVVAVGAAALEQYGLGKQR